MRNRIVLIFAGLLLALLLTGITTLVQAALIPPLTYSKHTLVIENWPCQEDENLRGFRTGATWNGKKYSFYRCVVPRTR